MKRAKMLTSYITRPLKSYPFHDDAGSKRGFVWYKSKCFPLTIPLLPKVSLAPIVVHLCPFKMSVRDDVMGSLEEGGSWGGSLGNLRG